MPRLRTTCWNRVSPGYAYCFLALVGLCACPLQIPRLGLYSNLLSQRAMAKASSPYPSSLHPSRSQSADSPASVKAVERRHSLPPPSSVLESDCFSPSLQPVSLKEDEKESSRSSSPDVNAVDKAGMPVDVDARTRTSPSSRPIPVFHGSRTPTRARGHARSAQSLDSPAMRTWSALRSSQIVDPPYYPGPYHHSYTPSPIHQPSPLPTLIVPTVRPQLSSVHGSSASAYHHHPHAQFSPENHGSSYPNALHLQGMPSLPSHASYAPPPPSYWLLYQLPYPAQAYPPAHGSPSVGRPADGYSQPPVTEGQGYYWPQR